MAPSIQSRSGGLTSKAPLATSRRSASQTGRSRRANGSFRCRAAAGAPPWAAENLDERERVWELRKRVQKQVEEANTPAEVLEAVQPAKRGVAECANQGIEEWDHVNLATALHRLAKTCTSNAGNTFKRRAEMVRKDNRFKVLLREVERRIDAIGSEGLDVIPWSLERLDVHSPARQVALRRRNEARKLRDELADFASGNRRSATSTPMEILVEHKEGVNDTTLAWALKASADSDRRADSERIEEMASLTREMAPYMRPGSLAMSISALAKMHGRNQRRRRDATERSTSIRQAAEDLLERSLELMPQLEPRHVPSIVSAASALRLDPRTKTIRKLSLLGSALAPKLTGSQIAQLLAGLASIMRGEAYSPGHQELHKALASFLEDPQARGEVSTCLHVASSLRRMRYDFSSALIDSLFSFALSASVAEAGDRVSEDRSRLPELLREVTLLGHCVGEEKVKDLLRYVSQGAIEFDAKGAVMVARALAVQARNEEGEDARGAAAELTRMMSSSGDGCDTHAKLQKVGNKGARSWLERRVEGRGEEA